MYRFNILLIQYLRVLKNLNTTHVSVQSTKIEIHQKTKLYLNTTHVSVQSVKRDNNVKPISYLNTTHVSVQSSNTQAEHTYTSAFKYNPCIGSIRG